MASNDDSGYLNRFFRQANRFPTLRLLHRYLLKDAPKSASNRHSRRRSLNVPRGRAAVIEFSEGSRPGDVVQTQRHFHSLGELIDYLSDRRRCRRRLFMMEDLWLPYVSAFGQYLDVDPRVFASQYRCVHWDNVRHGVQRKLRSCRNSPNTSDYYTLKYFEIWNLEEPQLARRNTFGDNGNWSPAYNTTGDPSRELVMSPMPVKREVSLYNRAPLNGRRGSTSEKSGGKWNRDQNGKERKAYVLRGNASFWYRIYDRDSDDWDGEWCNHPSNGQADSP